MNQIEDITFTGNYQISNVDSRRISILKVWLTIMVVFIHSYSEEVKLLTGTVDFSTPFWLEIIKYVISQCISRCAVPAFFLISAILLYRKPFVWKDNLKKKIRTLLVPYVLINSLWIVIYYACQHISRLSVYFANESNIIANWKMADWLQAYGIPGGCPIVYPLWFIRSLFILNIFAVIIKKIVEKFKWCSFLILLVIWLFTDASVAQSICFWGFGCFLVCADIRLDFFDRINKCALWLIYMFMIMGDVLTRTYKINSMIHNICIIVGIVFWFVCLTNFKNNKMNEILLFISSYSFNIYLFHEMNLSFLRKLSVKLLPASTIYQVLEYILIPIIIAFGVLLFSVVLKKICPRIYGAITGNRVR